MIRDKMSDNADFSVWSNDEIELLDTIDNEIKLVSNGSESESQGNHINGEKWKAFEKNDNGLCNEIRQSELNCPEELVYDSTKIDSLKSHLSSNDLSELSVDKAQQSESVPNNVMKISNSVSCNNVKLHNDNQRKFVMENKEDYLEEINKRLAMELEEKDALLIKLQENYENLLLKYAEAQNKIDQLRLKTVCKSAADCVVHKQNFTRTNFQLPVNNKEHQEWEDVKCQKAVVAPFMKDDFQEKVKVERPSSLPLDTNLKVMERENVKAATPTDSEGVSSVITSMSGHSKILNTLDVHSPSGRDLKYPERDFILGESSVVNDAFDKVKNWQNSLPPLELIETPETTLYDESPNYAMPSPKNGTEEVYGKGAPKYNEDDDVNQAEFKEYLRTLSLPMRKKSGMKKRSNEQSEGGHSPKDDIPSGCIIQRRKKPTLLRCSSLPAYDCDSPKSNRKVYIPPLDLENLTLSDVESSQVEYGDYNNRVSSSYVTSQSGSMEFSSQTYRTMNKGKLSDYTDYLPKPSFNKSTSITPERCGEMVLSKNLCRVCGENVGDRGPENFPFRSSSYQSFQDVQDVTSKSSERRAKHPFNRSVSFNSESRRCLHMQDGYPNRRSQDSLEKFDVYTNNLKARSQVVMKALAAHVNNN